MKTIGFIDYYLDEYHANHYPDWIREADRGFDVHLAWEETTLEGGKPLRAWCEEHGVNPAESMEQVVDECDCVVILAPSNPETHESLANMSLKSGKPVYIDKPFAPDRKTAERLFQTAEAHGTPLMSSSALRFGEAFQKAASESHAGRQARFVNVRGGGSSFWEYAIHQLEMTVTLMGVGARRVMQCGDDTTGHMVIDYADGRRAAMTLNSQQSFAISAYYQDAPPVIIDKMDGFWAGFIQSLLTFFDTGESCVPKEQTLQIASLVETGVNALKIKDQWVCV